MQLYAHRCRGTSVGSACRPAAQGVWGGGVRAGRSAEGWLMQRHKAGWHPRAASWALHASSHVRNRVPMATWQQRVRRRAGRANLAPCGQTAIKQCCKQAGSVGGRWRGQQASRKQSAIAQVLASTQMWRATLQMRPTGQAKCAACDSIQPRMASPHAIAQLSTKNCPVKDAEVSNESQAAPG